MVVLPSPSSSLRYNFKNYCYYFVFFSTFNWNDPTYRRHSLWISGLASDTLLPNEGVCGVRHMWFTGSPWSSMLDEDIQPVLFRQAGRSGNINNQIFYFLSDTTSLECHLFALSFGKSFTKVAKALEKNMRTR